MGRVVKTRPRHDGLQIAMLCTHVSWKSPVMLPCEFEGTLINEMRSNGHPKVGVSGNSSQGKLLLGKNRPRTMLQARLATQSAKLQPDPITDLDIHSIQGYYATYRISAWVLFRKVLHRASDPETIVARSPTWTPTSLGAFCMMLSCEFQGTLIHGMSSNGHRKIGRPEISSSRKTVAPKNRSRAMLQDRLATHPRPWALRLGC